VLSFATATLGATIPGFLEVGWGGSGLAIRAGGALALFVLIFFYTPDLVARERAQGAVSAPGGVAAEVIKNSSINTSITQVQQGMKECNQQIINNYGQINVTCTNKQQPNVADLRVIDTYLEDRSLNIKLQNIGQGTAFLYELRFLVYPGYGVLSICMPVFFTVIDFPFSAEYRDQYLSLTNKNESNVPEELKTIPQTLRRYMHPQHSISPTETDPTKSTLRETESADPTRLNVGVTEPVPIFLSPPLKLSEQVKPGDVEWLKIKIDTDSEHGTPGPDSCKWTEVYDVHVVVSYDDGKRILTPIFQLKWLHK
jgi:hypothetical protein